MKKVLIVDDEIEIRSVLKHLLETQFDAKVIEARDGHEAFWKVSNDHFDLVITDLIMPKMNGTNFIKQMNRLDEKNRPKEVMILSGALTPQLRMDLKSKGVTSLDKPFNLEELISQIKMILR